MRRHWGFTTVAVAAGLALAPAAQAADTFADAAIGSDANACTSAASPCETVGAAVGKSGPGDTIRVAPGVYAEQVELGGGRSLRAIGTAASTVIDAAASPAVDVTAAAGTIQGFTIRAPGSEGIGTLRLQASATVRGNVFDSDDDAGGTSRPVDLRIAAGAGGPVVTENSFADDGSGNQTAIATASSGSPDISENRIDGFFRGVDVSSGTPTVRDNVLRETHNSPTLSTGAAIIAQDGAANTAPQITANLIAAPAADAPNGVTVIDFVHGPGSTTVGATLRRNRILDHSFGVFVSNATNSPVTLESDLIARSATLGLSAGDSVGGASNVTATNVTLADNNIDVFGSDVTFTFNSMIVEDPIGGTVGTNCVITFSRLSATLTPSIPSCDDSATTAAPAYVDAANRDYHLLGFPSNPTLFSQGDPASPPAGTRDFDGDLRELPANGTSAPRREIGGDEILPGGYSPAETSISTGPQPGGTTSGSPSFGFTSTSPTSTFECSLDDRAFAPCTSPKSYAGLRPGAHTFAVRTIDPSLQGNTDPTPATRSFTVDGSPPETQIQDGPAPGSVTDATPTFALSSEAGASFECSVDRAAFEACGATFEPSGLSDGQHRLAVRAVDAVGNADPTAATRSWNVDATAPETTIDSGPADGSSTSSPSATYAFSADEAATFECATDGGGFSPCTSPVTLADLAAGDRSFAVRAIDSVGNVDSSPATRTLIVTRGGGGDDDTDPPETTIRKVKVRGDDAKAKFFSDEPGSTFECKLDRKRFRPCRSPRKLKNLDDGRHKLRVRAVDPAGNRDPSPAKKRFAV